MSLKKSPAFFPGNTIAMADSYVVNSGNETVAALFELDLTDIRKHLREKRENGETVALSAWIVKLISTSLADKVLDEYPKNLNYAMWVEKKINDQLYSIPLNLDNAANRSIEDISREIGFAKGTFTKERNFLKQSKHPRFFKHWLFLPGYLRKMIWRFLMKKPDLAYHKLGNGAFSYISTSGKYKNESTHINSGNISLAISSLIQKPRFINYEFKMRDIVPVTIMLNKKMMCNQDVTYFMRDLSKHINNNAAFVC